MVETTLDGHVAALVNLVGLLRLVVGLVMGLLTVFLLAERRAPVQA